MSEVEGLLCLIEGCGSTLSKKGYCNKHYLRLYRHGNPLAGRTFCGEPMKWLEDNAGFAGDECLIWPFGDGRRGDVLVNGRAKPAPQIMCEIANGPAPKDAPHALHACGKGHLKCCHPKHLYWGDHQQNMDDKHIHGTLAKGERHGRAKLREDDVREIRRLRSKGCIQKEIAERFGVSRGAILLIEHRRRWGWLTD